MRDKDEKSVPPKALTEMTKADDSKEPFSPVEEEMRAKRAIRGRAMENFASRCTLKNRKAKAAKVLSTFRLADSIELPHGGMAARHAPRAKARPAASVVRRVMTGS